MPFVHVAFAVLVAVSVAGCSDDAPSALDPAGDEAGRLAGVWWLMFGLAAAVYVVVAGLIVFAVLRRRATHPPSSDPAVASADGRRRRSDSTFIWAGGVVGPALILLVLAVVTVRTTAALRRPDTRALRIGVEGVQYWWDIRYPDQGIVTANEVHVPVGRPVEVALTSRDVIHSFWVPELAGKVDTVPGQRNVLRFTAEEAGVYLGECAEFCGVQHAHMQFVVVAEAPGVFERWVARHRRPPAEPVSERAAQGRRVFERESCAGCHRIAGTQAQGTFGPDLTDFGSRRTIGAGTVPNTRGHLGGWIANSQSIKPGNPMPPISLEADELLALIDYLETLK